MGLELLTARLAPLLPLKHWALHRVLPGAATATLLPAPGWKPRREPLGKGLKLQLFQSHLCKLVFAHWRGYSGRRETLQTAVFTVPRPFAQFHHSTFRWPTHMACGWQLGPTAEDNMAVVGSSPDPSVPGDPHWSTGQSPKCSVLSDWFLKNRKRSHSIWLDKLKIKLVKHRPGQLFYHTFPPLNRNKVWFFFRITSFFSPCKVLHHHTTSVQHYAQFVAWPQKGCKMSASYSAVNLALLGTRIITHSGMLLRGHSVKGLCAAWCLNA